LAKHFLKKVAIKFHLPIKTINEQGMGLFYNYIWPGNIREFENLIERLFVICPGEEIESKIVAAHIGSIQQTTKEGITIPIDDALYAFEKNLLRQAMKEAGGIKNKAAKLLGLNTSTLYYKLEKFGL
jgi:DNA-binding NtrC family response regulator